MTRWQKAGGGILIFSLSIFSGNGCVKTFPPTVKPMITSAPAIIQILEARKKTIQDLKAIAHLSLASPERKLSVKQAILVRKPHYLRAETLSFFGNPIFYLFADDRQISFYNPREKSLFKGSSRVDNIFRLTGIPLEIPEIVAILCGDVPFSNISTDQAELHFEAENSLYSLRLRPYEEIELGAVDLLPRRYRLAEKLGGKYQTYIEVNYQKYHEIDSRLFPLNIRIRFYQAGITVQIRYKEVKLNQAIPTTSFELPQLEGVEVIDLDDGWANEKR